MSEVSFPDIEKAERVGSGHAGEVFWVRRQDGTELAVKRLDAMAIDRDRLGRNCRRHLQAPPHPGVVPLVGFQVGASPYFIASEWSKEGCTLASLAGSLAEEAAWPLILEIAGALAHLHRHGVHHSNLHPGNVFVESADPLRVRVADAGPGLAGRVHHLDLGDSAWFAPPEQLEQPSAWEDGAVERWDVYRFGALAYWMINGKAPRGGVYRACLDALVAEGGGRPAPVDLALLALDMRGQEAVVWDVPAVDRETQVRREVLERCLSLDPAIRPVDLREVVEAFAEIERKLASERAEELHQAALAETEAQVKREKARHLARLQRVRLVAACLLGSLLLMSALLVRYFQRSHSFQNRVSEMGLIIGQQSSEIEALDRHRSQSAHELRTAREAADAVFSHISTTGEESDLAPAEGSVEWENLQKSRAFIVASLQVSESDPAKSLERARDLQHLAHVETRLGRGEEAGEHLRQSVALFERELAGGKMEAELRQDCESRLADGYEALAALIDQDPGEEKLAALSEASRYLRIVAERRPQDRQLAQRRMAADFRLGRQLHEHRGFDAALAAFDSVVAQLDKLKASEPESAPLLEMLAEVRYHTALSLRETGRTREAADAYALALETLAQLTGDRALTEEQSLRLGMIYTDLGELFAGKVPDEESSQLLNEAQRLLNPIHERRPQHLEAAGALSRTLSQLARIGQRQDRWKDSYRMSVAAVENLEAALAGDPASIESRLLLVELRAGHVELVRYQKTAAEKVLGKGFEMAEAVRADLEADTAMSRGIRQGWRLKLAQIYETYGKLSESFGDSDRARLCQERATQTRQLLASRDPVSAPDATF